MIQTNPQRFRMCKATYYLAGEIMYFSYVLNIWAFVFRICFGFRISRFGFVGLLSLLPINPFKDLICAGRKKPSGQANAYLFSLTPFSSDFISDDIGTIQLSHHPL
jgi:hypothetical protein